MSKEIDIQLYKSLCDATDIEAELKKYEDWNLLYSFSTARKNLYEWYEFDSSASLLEIGAGCGVLTEFFGTKVSKVTAIEADKDMAEINSYRNKDNENITVINSDYDSFDLNEKYNYIIITGTLEDTPAAKLLTKAKELLTAEGIIFVAISNRMGLQYLAGVTDEKIGTPFEGFSTKSGLFSRKQALEIINEAGLIVEDTYYPMPDYRFASVIYSDDYLPLMGDYQISNVSFSDKSYKLFDETTAADVLIDSNEFINFANSYLFILRK